MAMIDPEKERARLIRRYAELTLGQLQKIAADAPELTEMARQLLSEEITRRGAKPAFPVPDKQPEPPPPPPVELPESAPPVLPEITSAVFLRRFRDLPEALLAKGRLEASGINCFLADDNMVRLDWFISNLLGGVKLMVDEADVEDAESVLDQPPPESFEVEAIGEYQQPRCPKCGSLDVSFEELDKKFSYATAFFKVPIPMHIKGWNCHACKHHWDGPADDGRGNEPQ